MVKQTSRAKEVPEVNRLTASVPTALNVPGVTFIQHSGYISEGGDLLRTSMTIPEAMRTAATLPGCSGFCFHGESTEGVVDVWFKNKSTGALCECSDKWTSLQLVRDHIVHDRPACIEKTQDILEILALGVNASVAVPEEEPTKGCDMESQIALIIRTLDGCENTIMAPGGNTTLGELKALIQEEKGESQDYRLCLDTRLLSGDRNTLSALGIADKAVLTLTRKPECKWKLKTGRTVEGISRRAAGVDGEAQSHVVCTESHGGYDKQIGSVIRSAKARCEEQEWAGFVLVNFTTEVLHTGLCDWPDPLDCQVHYLGKTFLDSANSIPAAAQTSESSSGVRHTTTTYDLHYIE